MSKETDKELCQRVLCQHELNRDGHSGQRESLEVDLARRLLAAAEELDKIKSAYKVLTFDLAEAENRMKAIADRPKEN